MSGLEEFHFRFFLRSITTLLGEIWACPTLAEARGDGDLLGLGGAAQGILVQAADGLSSNKN